MNNHTVRPFYFIHIAKTGGQSIRSAIKDAAIESGVSFNVFNVKDDKNVDKMVIASAEQYQKDRIPNAITFTILREPNKRIISAYYYTLRQVGRGRPEATGAGNNRAYHRFSKILSRHELDIVCQWDGNTVFDDFPRQISDKIIDTFAGDMVRKFSSSCSLEEACENLEGLSGFGLTEQMGKTEEILNSIWPFEVPVKIGRKNVGPVMPPPSEEMLALITARQEKDLKLYSFAVNLFKDRYGGSASAKK